MRKTFFVAAFLCGLCAASVANAFPFGANSDSNLKRLTAQAVMNETHQLVEPSQITIVSRRGGMIGGVSWQADTPNGRYVCNSSDDMMRNWSCARIEQPPAQTAEN